MELNEWLAKYRPLKNHLDTNASWQDDSGEGIMFETYGKELDYVRSMEQSYPNCVWTYVDGGGGAMLIINGYHLVDRLGYFVTEVASTDQNVYVQVYEPDEE